MTTYLDRIIDAHRAAAAADARTLESLTSRVSDLAPTRGFGRALADTDGLGVIAEVKRRSPSKGPLAPDLDPAILAHIDYSSDEALQNSLQVAALASRAQAAAPPAPVPPAVQPPAPQFASYLERSKLFREDPVAYQRMIEQESAALKAQQ